jgi:hypothetical protein
MRNALRLFYPLNGEAGAKPMKCPDASGVPLNMLPISDGSAFDQLKKLVDSGGANLAGPDWLGMLAAIAIIKGQPFTPDARQGSSRAGARSCGRCSSSCSRLRDARAAA